jgi:hypothetical protein
MLVGGVGRGYASRCDFERRGTAMKKHTGCMAVAAMVGLCAAVAAESPFGELRGNQQGT